MDPTAPVVDRGQRVIALTWGTWAPAAVFVGLRLYARIRSKAFGFDDACIIVALLISLFGAICNVFEVHNGFGKSGSLTENELENLIHWALASEIQAVVGVMITKISVCWFVLRLLGKTHRWMRRVIWACMGLSFVTALMYVLSQAFVCIPLEAYWNPRVHGRCISKQTISNILLPTNIVNVVTEFTCAALPFYLISHLQMRPSDKKLLLVLTAFGFLAASTSIAQAVLVRQYATASGPDLVYPTYWVIVNQNFSIVVASAPGCWHFIRLMNGHVKQMTSSTQRTRSTSTSQQRLVVSEGLQSLSKVLRIGKTPSHASKEQDDHSIGASV